MSFQYANVAFGIVFGAAFVLANILVISKLLAPNVKDENKLSTYECGEPPIGSAWVRFDMRFYTTALVFLIFEVEVAFLFPWAAVYNQLVNVGSEIGFAARLFPFLEVALFVGILGVGLVYVWAKGDLDWVKSLAGQRVPKTPAATEAVKAADEPAKVTV